MKRWRAFRAVAKSGPGLSGFRCAPSGLQSNKPERTLPIMSTVDKTGAVERLMRFLAIEGVTGQEAAIGRELAAALKDVGIPESAIRLDDANKQIPLPTETGNLIVD